MLLTETKLKGSYIIDPERFTDERGFFARAYSEREFAEAGIDAHFIEGNLSFNLKKGSLRGMHYQAAPHGQAKLIRCTRGAIFDVGIDLRPDSPTFKQWISVELSAANQRMLFIPRDFAHGYLTLEDATEVSYQVTCEYHPQSSRGFRWNDPAFAVEWPLIENLVINERDRTYPDFMMEDDGPRASAR
jgi:dTDP-4-dehydrorhamnose 3,5-epimerase